MLLHEFTWISLWMFAFLSCDTKCYKTEQDLTNGAPQHGGARDSRTCGQIFRDNGGQKSGLWLFFISLRWKHRYVWRCTTSYFKRSWRHERSCSKRQSRGTGLRSRWWYETGSRQCEDAVVSQLCAHIRAFGTKDTCPKQSRARPLWSVTVPTGRHRGANEELRNSSRIFLRDSTNAFRDLAVIEKDM